MDTPLKIACETCNSEASVIMAGHADGTGKRIEWPKAAVKSDGIYFSIDCPLCGLREQCVAKPCDVD